MKAALEKVVKVENVKKSFKVGTGDVEVLRGISLQIDPGEFMIIVGPSGCGKSTLLHIMLGLEKPTSGSVTIMGEKIYSDDPNVELSEDQLAVLRKRSVGMVYQQPHWIRSLTVVDNVALSLLLNGHSKVEAIKAAYDMLKKVGMIQWASYIPTELSSGQQQRVALARALLSDPQILIADEPTGNLDLESGKELMEIFTELNREGKSILMVTHDLEYLRYASRVVKIVDGQIDQERRKKSAKID